MSEAIIVVGDEDRHEILARGFERFLKTLGIDRTQIIFASHASSNWLLDILRGTLASVSGPTLVVYIGHGSEAGWAIGAFSLVVYEQLVSLFSQVNHPLLIVNATCHAHALADYFSEVHKASGAEIGLISACPAAGEANADQFLYALAHDWRIRQEFKAERSILHQRVLVKIAEPRSFLQRCVNRLRKRLGPLMYRFSRKNKVERGEIDSLDPAEEIIISSNLVVSAYRKRWGAVLDSMFFPAE